MQTTARPHTPFRSVPREAVPHPVGEYGGPQLFPNPLPSPNPEQQPSGQQHQIPQSPGLENLRQQQNLDGNYQPYFAELSPPLPGPSPGTPMPESRKTPLRGHSASNPISGFMQHLFPTIWPHPSHFSSNRKSSSRHSFNTLDQSLNSSARSRFNGHLGAHHVGTQPFNQSSVSSQPPAVQHSATYGTHQSGGNQYGGNQSNGVQSSPPRASMGISNVQYLMTGGCLLLALVLMTDVQQWLPKAEVKDICQEVIQPDAILSRTHLAQLLAVSERTAKTAIQQVVAEPYCRLPSVSIRAGITAEREVYPLAFDPDTWLVMLYEGDEYAGFDFSFRK